MKKSVLLAAIAIVVFSCNSSSPQKSDLESANLKGKVWKVSRTINETGVSCGCSIKTDCNLSEYEYNEKGNLVVSYTIDENKVTNDSSAYLYNKHGMCTGVTKYRMSKPAGKEVPVVKNGNIAGYKFFNETGELTANTKYLKSGNEITEEKTIDNTGKELNTILKEFVNGQLVTLTEKDGSGNTVSISRYKRNSKNDVEECLTLITKDNKEFKLTYEYEYDEAGNWTKQTQYYGGEIINIVIRNILYYKS